MHSFNYVNPCRVIFGDEAIAQSGRLAVAFGTRTLLVTGSGSIKRNGIFKIITESLAAAGVSFVEHSGVKSNPVISHAREGIALAKSFMPDSIIAVGGGSVIDEAKTIAFGALSDDDPWEVFKNGFKPQKALPVLAIPTIFGSGSELNTGSVMSDPATHDKRGISAQSLIPHAALIDPAVSVSVPPDLQSAGFIDALSHIMEGYFNGAELYVPVQDSLSEALAKTLIELSQTLMSNPNDMNCRRNAVWACCLAHEGQLNMGRGKITFELHALAHALGSAFDIHHGNVIAILMVPWLRSLTGARRGKISSFGQAVFGFSQGEKPEELQAKTFAMLAEWIRALNAPTSISAFLKQNDAASKAEIQSRVHAAIIDKNQFHFSECQIAELAESIS